MGALVWISPEVLVTPHPGESDSAKPEATGDVEPCTRNFWARRTRLHRGVLQPEVRQPIGLMPEWLRHNPLPCNCADQRRLIAGL